MYLSVETAVKLFEISEITEPGLVHRCYIYLIIHIYL